MVRGSGRITSYNVCYTKLLRVLSRLWQMLLKAIEEVSSAPNAMMAAEMALIRMTHVV